MDVASKSRWWGVRSISSATVPDTPVTCQVLDSIWSGLRDLHVECTARRFTDAPGSRSHATLGSGMCFM